MFRFFRKIGRRFFKGRVKCLGVRRFDPHLCRDLGLILLPEEEVWQKIERARWH